MMFANSFRHHSHGLHGMVGILVSNLSECLLMVDMACGCGDEAQTWLKPGSCRGGCGDM